MAVTVSQLLEEFPEFKRCAPPLVAAKLRDAEAFTSADYPTPLREQRVKYMACELLALSPGAEFARLDPNKEPDGARSLYERQRLEIDRANAAPMVI
jgi:hypothetical protein